MSSRLGMRALLLGGCTFAMLVVLAAPASAHTLSGPQPPNFRAEPASIEPRLPGVGGRVADLGRQLALTHRPPKEGTVSGYTGEPYLRTGPDGVLENIHSSAT